MRTLLTTAVIAAGFFLSPAQASTPSSGTLSPSTPTLTYTYGPNAASNPSGTCMAPALACDAYALTINLPAGSPAYRVTVTTSWTAAADDYDVSMLSSTGGVVGSSAGSDNPETFTVPATAGTFNVRVVPFAVTGSTATTKITLTVAAPTTGGGAGTTPVVFVQPTGQAPRYHNHTSPAALANDAGEPTMGYNPLTKRAMYIAFTQANRVTFRENLPAPADPLNATLPESCDALWEDKSGTLTTLNTLDPLMYTDKKTGRTFNSQLSGANSLFEYSDNDGQSWTPGQIGPANGGADHQGMITGPYPAGFPAASLPTNPGYAFYYCSQSVAAAFCARSDDGGRTQGPGTAFKNLDCAAGGLHGHPQISPKDGALYIPDSSQCLAGTGLGGGSSDKVIVHRSLDAGMTYTTLPIPTSTGGAGSDPSVGIATDGTLYMCYENADGRAHVAVSKTRGDTWINDVDIGAAAGLVATRFQAAIAGDPDRASCAFLGTKTEGASDSLDFKGVWYPYVATTYDGGLSWHLVNVSPKDPVQGFGGIGSAGTNRNLLDFNDLEIDERGRTLFAWSDGCTGGCVLDQSANSFAAKGIITRQTGGRTLFKSFDDKADTQYNAVAPIKPTSACAVQALSTRTKAITKVAWNEPDTGGSGITNYEVFRATSPAGPFASVGNSGIKTTFTDDTASPDVAKYYYRIVAENPQGKAAAGNIIELPISVATVVDTCKLPGEVLATDPVDQNGATDLDATLLAVAEPIAFEGNLVITLKVADFAGNQPAGVFYGILFPTRGDKYIALDSTDGTVSYDFGTFATLPQGVLQFNRAGALDARSTFAADGTMTLVVPKSFFGGLKVGDVLAGFDVRIRAGSSTATSRDTIGPADYVVRGTSICLPNVAPIAILAADKDSAKANDSITFTVSGTDADTGDKIAKFTLSFGDGETITDREITTLPVTLTHKYAANGNYMARLTVTDSRGLVSSNVGSKFINIAGTGVTPTTIAPPTANANGTESAGRFGGAFGFALLPLALLALRRRRQ